MKYHVGDILFSKLSDKYAFTVVKTKGDRMCIVASHYRFGKKKRCKGGVTVTYDEINIGDILIASPGDKTYRKIQKRAVVL